MKALPRRSVAARRILLHVALLVTATSASGIACSTTDEVLAWEDSPDAGPSIVFDGGTKNDAAAVCGNGIREDGEACEDGNLTNGDGCSSTCTVEKAAPNVCPGTVLPLDASNPAKRVGSVSGDTSGRPLSFDSPTCGGGNGKDVVYAITADVQGQARVRLDAAFDALLYVRTTCTNAATEVSCKTVPVGGGRTDISFPMAKNQTAYLVVDGVGGKSGKFQLDVEIGATSCGDGVAQHPEQCDDGNTTPGDGCSASCQLETPLSAAGKCPGASFTLVGSTSAPVKTSFAGDISQLASTGGAFGCGGGSSADQVYAITPTTSGAITAELHASYDKALLHARTECFTSGTELDCREGTAPSVPTRVTFPVVAQNTYFVFVDADEKPASGLYTLDVTLSPATCGNGAIESPETCDDGNTMDGDGCSATCALEPMPAGIDNCPGAPITFATGAGGTVTFKTSASTTPLTSGVKSCTAQTDRKDAVYTFVAPFDGLLKAKAKGSFNLVLDLRTNCVAESVSSTAGSVACGSDWQGDDEETLQGAVNAGATYYVIVDGGFYNTNKDGPFSLAIEIAPSVCGNGVIEGGEDCDDGANAPGDGCGPTCKLEPPPATRATCATAEPIPLVENTPGEFTATVTSGNWNLSHIGTFTGGCGGAGKEAYYTVTAPIDGTLVANVDATYNIIPGVRLACPHTGTTFVTCSNRSLGAGAERLALPVKAGTKYWIILDASAANQVGNYAMDLSLKAESCGDFVVNGTEQCDDGNVVPGDGCSPTCTVEPLSGVDECPGHAVALTGVGTATRQKQLTISTTTLASNYSAKCGGSGRDGVVAVTSDIAGTLVAQLVSAWPAVFYARSTCTGSATELKCSEADPAKPTDTLREISLPVTPNVPVYLFVDGLAGASGAANLSLTVNP